jgi:hypothetical protein
VADEAGDGVDVEVGVGNGFGVGFGVGFPVELAVGATVTTVVGAGVGVGVGVAEDEPAGQKLSVSPAYSTSLSMARFSQGLGWCADTGWLPPVTAKLTAIRPRIATAATRRPPKVWRQRGGRLIRSLNMVKDPWSGEAAGLGQHPRRRASSSP